MVFEKAKENYSAYSPDVPGCIATGMTRGEAEQSIREAIRFHIEGCGKRACQPLSLCHPPCT